jgi:hypothetical protein
MSHKTDQQPSWVKEAIAANPKLAKGFKDTPAAPGETPDAYIMRVKRLAAECEAQLEALRAEKRRRRRERIGMKGV